MKKLLFALGCAFVLASCTNDNNKPQSEGPLTEEPLVDEEMEMLRNSFPQLFAYFGNSDTSFASELFSMTGNQQLDTTVVTAVSEKQTEQFRSCLVFSPDSSQAVDLFSYNYVLVPNGSGFRAEQGGPDTEAALIDFKKGTRKRIYFTGPSSALVDAKWLTDGSFLLAGGEVLPHEGFVPFIWKVNPANGNADVYSYPDTLQVSPASYKRTLCKLLQ
jgi:hypothetical protein